MRVSILRCHPFVGLFTVLLFQPAIGIDDFHSVDLVNHVVLSCGWRFGDLSTDRLGGDRKEQTKRKDCAPANAGRGKRNTG